MKRFFSLIVLAMIFTACSSNNAPLEPQAFVISYPSSNILPKAHVGVYYGVPLSTLGGTWPVEWTIISGKYQG